MSRLTVEAVAGAFLRPEALQRLWAVVGDMRPSEIGIAPTTAFADSITPWILECARQIVMAANIEADCDDEAAAAVRSLLAQVERLCPASRLRAMQGELATVRRYFPESK